jgi:hypothetical protein
MGGQGRVALVTTSALLADSRFLLGKLLQLHLHSVKIGQMEPIADSGVIDEEIHQVRTLIEQADRLCARIDREGQRR